MLSIEEAHERDMAEQRQIRDVRRHLETFLRDAPRLHRFARLAVEHAVEQLLEEEQRLRQAVGMSPDPGQRGSA